METNTKNKHDVCVVCGEETEYAEMDHVLARNFYVEGAGQLCQLCFDNSNSYYAKKEEN